MAGFHPAAAADADAAAREAAVLLARSGELDAALSRLAALHERHPADARVRHDLAVVSAWAGDKRPVLQELGITDVLPKPFLRQQLEQLIAESL